MRRILLGLILLLPGCDYVGSPVAGFGGFMGDTHNIYRGPNEPPGDSVNMRRVQGEPAPSEPLLPEAGNVWPGPPQPEPTLEDIERQMHLESPTPPGEEFPRLPPPQGSSTPFVPHPQPRPEQPPATSSLPPRSAPAVQGSPSVVVQTQQGPATITTGANGEKSFVMPDGSSGHVVVNGNGTLTLIGVDGRVQTVQAPR